MNPVLANVIAVAATLLIFAALWWLTRFLHRAERAEMRRVEEAVRRQTTTHKTTDTTDEKGTTMTEQNVYRTGDIAKLKKLAAIRVTAANTGKVDAFMRKHSRQRNDPWERRAKASLGNWIVAGTSDDLPDLLLNISNEEFLRRYTLVAGDVKPSEEPKEFEAKLERRGPVRGGKSGWRLTWQQDGEEQSFYDSEDLKRPDWPHLINRLSARGLRVKQVNEGGGGSPADKFPLTLAKIEEKAPEAAKSAGELFKLVADEIQPFTFTTGPSAFSVTGRFAPVSDEADALARVILGGSSQSTEDRLIASARELVRTGEALKEATKAQKVVQDRHNRAQAKHRELTQSLAS